MITIEGASGSDAVWCLQGYVPLYEGNVPLQIYPLDSYRYFNSTQPSEFILPKDQGVWHPVDSYYGPRCLTRQIGTIISPLSRSKYKPCQHSTITGGLRFDGVGGERQPYLGTVGLYNRRLYTHDQKIGYVATGLPISVVTVSYRKTRTVPGAYGDPVKVSALRSNKFLWSDDEQFVLNWNATYPDSIFDPAIEGPIVPSNGYYNSANGDFSPSGSYIYCRDTVVRTGQNTWTETIWREYISGVRPGATDHRAPVSLGFKGLNNTVVYAKWTITYEVLAIQQKSTGLFQIRQKVEQRLQSGSWALFSHDPIDYDTTQRSEELTYIYTLFPGCVSDLSVNLDKLDTYCEIASPRAQSLRDSEMQKIARSNAISDTFGLESNWIENLSQVKGTMAVIQPLLLGFKAIKCGDVDAGRKALAGAYLAYKYMIAPTISDGEDLNDNLINVLNASTKYRYSYERRRGAAFSKGIPVVDTLADIAYHTTFHLQLKDDSFSQIWSALDRLGLDISADNLWDLIPFSFVVDWFISVGPALTRMSDYSNSIVTRNLIARIESFKVQWPLTDACREYWLPAELVPTGSPITYVWYDRRIAHRFGSIDPFAGQENDGVTSSQMTQGIALLSSYR